MLDLTLCLYRWNKKSEKKSLFHTYEIRKK